MVSSLAHRFCVGTKADLEKLVRSKGDVRDVIERDCDLSESSVVVEQVDESTRNVARRRQILPGTLLIVGWSRIRTLAYILADMVGTDADLEWIALLRLLKS